MNWFFKIFIQEKIKRVVAWRGSNYYVAVIRFESLSHCLGVFIVDFSVLISQSNISRELYVNSGCFLSSIMTTLMSVRWWLSLILPRKLPSACVLEKILDFSWSFQTIFSSFVFKHFRYYLILRQNIRVIFNRQITFHFLYYYVNSFNLLTTNVSVI